MPQNIVFPMYFYPPWVGGAEIFTSTLAERLVLENHKVIIVTNTLKVLPTIEEKSGLVIHRFNPITMRKNPAYFFNVGPFVKKLNDVIKMEGIEIIHAHAHIFSLFSATISGKLTKTPTIYTAHGSDLLVHPKKRVYRFLLKLLLPRANIITGTSPKIVEYAKRICRDKTDINYIPNAISFPVKNPKIIENDTATDFCIAFVGRLHRIKGIKYLIHAFHRFKRKYQHSKLMIVGSGSELPILQKLARTLNLKDSVEFLGFRKDVESILQKEADVLVLPSLSESFPMIILTAFKSGCPVIGTAVGGVPEMIIHEETGLLVEPANVSDLLEKLERYYCDVDLRRAISSRAFQFGKQHFSWKIILPKIIALYESLY